MSGKSLLGKSAVFLVIAVLAAMLIFTTTRKSTEVISETVLPVKTVSAEKGDLQKLLRISGFIESDTMVTVFPRIGGTLTEIYIEMGDPVKKDQIIALIDSEPYQLGFNQANAAFLAAESTYKRISSLYSTKSVSQQNYEEARANYDALKSSYELAELKLSYTKLKSPVSGVVLEEHVSRGAMVAPQIPVITIGDIKNLKVNSGIPEIHYSFFQKNKESMTVSISVPALENRKFRGHITHIAPYISPQSRNFIVKCEIEDYQSQLRPGMFAYLDFVLKKKEDIFYLPFKALVSDDELWYVDEQNKARKQNFTLLFNNEQYFQIPDDISEKKFIVEGQSFLKEGQSVR